MNDNYVSQEGNAYSGVGASQPMPMPENRHLGPYKFSQEELRVLQECNNESFFQRSLPISSVLGFGTYAALQKGYLRPNARFGVYPKVTLAVVVGYFIGKISYQQVCAEKLMALPDSYIGQLLRETRDGKPGPFKGKPTTAMFGAAPADIYSDAGPGNSLDLDTDRPIFSDDTYRPDDSISKTHLETIPIKPSISYDELRRQNRSQFADSRQDPYRVDPNSMSPVTRSRPTTPETSTNKYGDVME